jgi:hypothetical protein
VIVIIVDAGAIDHSGPGTVDALARMRLYAARAGVAIEIRNARRELVDLLQLVGLAAVLGVEVHGQAEQVEQRGIDEEIDPADSPL